MKEKEYILVSDLSKVRAALRCLEGLMTSGENGFVPAQERAVVFSLLGAWENAGAELASAITE
jgi:hypothetical protein